VTFETLDQSDEETGPDQKTDNDKDKYKKKTMRNTFREQIQRQKKDNDKDKYIESTFKERS